MTDRLIDVPLDVCQSLTGLIIPEFFMQNGQHCYQNFLVKFLNETSVNYHTHS